LGFAALRLLPFIEVGLEADLVEKCHETEARALVEELEVSVVFGRLVLSLVFRRRNNLSRRFCRFDCHLGSLRSLLLNRLFLELL